MQLFLKKGTWHRRFNLLHFMPCNDEDSHHVRFYHNLHFFSCYFHHFGFTLDCYIEFQIVKANTTQFVELLNYEVRHLFVNRNCQPVYQSPLDYYCVCVCRISSPRPSLLNYTHDGVNSTPLQKPMDLKQLKQRAATIPPIVSYSVGFCWKKFFFFPVRINK